MAKVERARPEPRMAYRWFRETATQWRDNDVYGHVNNAVHHTWFDSTVNGWLLERGLLVLGGNEMVGLVVANACQYFAEVAFPARVHCGLRAGRIGRSSVTYELGLFSGDAMQSFASGTLTHAYVVWPSRSPVVLSSGMRTALHELVHA